MKRFVTALVTLAVLGAGACDSASGAQGGPAGSVTQARTSACDTIQQARRDSSSALFNAISASDNTSTSQWDLAKAAADLDTALTAFGAAITTAAGRTTDPDLKAAATEFAAAIATMKAATAAAGTDRARLNAAVTAASFNAAERKVINLCFDVWNP